MLPPRQLPQVWKTHQVHGSLAVGQSKPEPFQEQRSSYLTRVGFLAELRSEVLVVRPNYERMLCSLQPVPPLLQSYHYCQLLTVSNVVVSLCRGQSCEEEGTRINLLVPRAEIVMPLPKSLRHPPQP